jgi:hypothetical protein
MALGAAGLAGLGKQAAAGSFCPAGFSAVLARGYVAV